MKNNDVTYTIVSIMMFMNSNCYIVSLVKVLNRNYRYQITFQFIINQGGFVPIFSKNSSKNGSFGPCFVLLGFLKKKPGPFYRPGFGEKSN